MEFIERTSRTLRALRPDLRPRRTDELPDRTSRLSACLSIISVGAAVASLLGWAFDLEFLKSGVPGLATMKANAAVGLILVGTSLLALRYRGLALLSSTLAAIVIVLGLLTIGQTIFGVDLGIDEALFKDTSQAIRTSAPGRMSPTTALLLSCLGFALLALHWNKASLARLLSLSVAFAAFLTIVGYAHDLSRLYQVGEHTAMALPTAVLLLTLSLAAVLARPTPGVRRLLNDRTLAGRELRRSLGIVTVLPLVTGVALYAGADAGLYQGRWVLPLFTLLATVALTSMVLLLAARWDRLEGERAEAQAALTASENRFRGSFNKAFVGIAHIQLDGHWLRVNDTLCSILGFPKDELLRLTLDEVVHPEDIVTLREQLTETAAGSIERCRIEIRCETKDAEEVWVDLQVAAQMDTSAGEPYVIATFLDITQSKQEEAYYRALAAVVETTEDFVGICDLDLRPTYVNRAGLLMVGLESLEVACEKNVLEYFWPDDLPRIEQEALQAVEEEGRWRGEVRFRHFQTGEPIHTWWNVTTIRDSDGEPIAYATVSPDLSRLKQTENKLRTATRRLKRANREKDRFLRLLGHELRNPLGAMQSALEVIRRSQGRHEHEKMHAIMERQTAQVARLVDDLVDLARVQTGQLSIALESCNLESFLTRVVEERGPEAESLEVELTLDTCSEPVPVQIDRARLRQVVHNLLTNAFRAAPGGRVDVHLRADDEAARIVVRDSGRGIAPEDLERIFDPFEQATPDRKNGGLGLGLPIARDLVARHEGTLTATSPGLGKGAEFAITLPRLQSPLAVSQADEATIVGNSADKAKAAEKRVVVLIDDHRDSADNLAELLGMEGHEAHVAYDGQQGLDMVRQRHPDVVVVDIYLPKIDIGELAKALRGVSSNQSTLLVGLTDLADSAQRALAPDTAFDICLTKPLDFEQLREVLQNTGTAAA